MLINTPQRMCDVCKAASGPSVVSIAVVVRQFKDDGTADKETSTDKIDVCLRCRKRLDSCIRTGVNPRTKGKDKAQVDALVADAMESTGGTGS